MIRASGNSSRMARVASAPLRPGQPQVHERDVGPLRAEERHRLLAGGGLRADREVLLQADDAGEPDPDQVVVVHQHDAQPLSHRSPRVRHGGPRPPAGTRTASRVPPSELELEEERRRRACPPARGCPAGRSVRRGLRPSGAKPWPSSLTTRSVLSAAEVELDVDAAARRVFDRVGEGLHADAEQVVLDGGGSARGVPVTRTSAWSGVPDVMRRARSCRAPATSRCSSACERRSCTDRRASSML